MSAPAAKPRYPIRVSEYVRSRLMASKVRLQGHEIALEAAPLNGRPLGSPVPHFAACRPSGSPDTSRRSVNSPDPARLERAATLTNDGLGASLPGRCALGGLVTKPRHQAAPGTPT